MLSEKQRWWAEAALDAVATFFLGWLILGGIVAALVPPGPDAGEFEKALPILVRVAVTWGVWKLFRGFDWLKGTPPASP